MICYQTLKVKLYIPTMSNTIQFSSLIVLHLTCRSIKKIINKGITS